MKNILNVARNVALIFACGLGIANTSRGMHTEPVSPYYAQLAAQTAKQPGDQKNQIILRGQIYVGAASK